MGRRAFVEQIMGLPVSVHVRGPTAADPSVARAVEAVFAELRALDAVFSTYREDSLVSAINNGEQVDHPLVDAIIELCAQAGERTYGYFDCRLPAPTGGTWFDPSGLVKGWAVERAAAHLDGFDYYVSAGGDMVVRGTWRVGVQDPIRSDQLITVVDVSNACVATSGGAHRGSHIVDPHSGRPARDLLAATVIGPSLTWADVYATAAVARGPQAIAWLAGLPGHAALLVTGDGNLLATPDWPGPALS